MGKKRKTQILTFNRALVMGSKKTDNTVINIYTGNARSKVTMVSYEFSTEEKSNSNVLKVARGKYIRFDDMKEDDADKFHKVFKTTMKQIKRADILYYARIEAFLQYILNYADINDYGENSEYRLVKQLLDKASYDLVRFSTTVNCTAIRVQESVNKKYKNIDKYISLQLITKIILSIYSLKSCDKYPCMIYKDRTKWGESGELVSEILFDTISLKTVDNVSSYLMNEYLPEIVENDIRIKNEPKFVYEPVRSIGVFRYELRDEIVRKLKKYVITIDETDTTVFSFVGFSKPTKNAEKPLNNYVINTRLNTIIPLENAIVSSIVKQKVELVFSYDDIMNIREIISNDIYKSSDNLSFEFMYTEREENERVLDIDVCNVHDIFFKSMNEKGFNAYNKRVNKHIEKA